MRYPPEPFPSYSLANVHQFSPWLTADIVPRDAAGRNAYERMLAMDATIYGLPSVYQYGDLYEEAVDRANPRYIGFNKFDHQRELASPTFTPFLTPNNDTLYSNAWLDLTAGPVEVEIPAFGSRYYTLNFLDMYSNATNLSLRTVGPDGGRFLVAPTSWRGEVPDGVKVFRVATPYMWILMRIFLRDHAADVKAVHRLQNAVKLRTTARAGRKKCFVEASPTSVREDWRTFLRVLDFVLRTNGHPTQEDAYTYRFRRIGLGGDQPLDLDTFDVATLEALEAGFDDAMAVVRGTRGQGGEPIGNTGWVKGNPGAYGFNYLRRAASNFLGLGGNVAVENQPYTNFLDSTGRPLDGSSADYTLHFGTPPPAHSGWSLTLYDARTFALSANEIERYEVGDRTPGLRYGDDGSLTVRLQRSRPADPSNWLPAPNGPFYLAIRAWQPKSATLKGEWLPEAVRRVEGN